MEIQELESETEFYEAEDDPDADDRQQGKWPNAPAAPKKVKPSDEARPAKDAKADEPAEVPEPPVAKPEATELLKTPVRGGSVASLTGTEATVETVASEGISQVEAETLMENLSSEEQRELMLTLQKIEQLEISQGSRCLQEDAETLE